MQPRARKTKVCDKADLYIYNNITCLLLTSNGSVVMNHFNNNNQHLSATLS